MILLNYNTKSMLSYIYMKQEYIYKQTLKQTIQMTTGLKNHLEILKKDRKSLSELLNEISLNNPFLEYSPSLDIQQYLESTISDKPSLKDELYYQLYTTHKKYNEKIASYIIESLDNNGFFDYHLKTVLTDLKCNETEFKKTLSFIQSFEPLGVAAKNSIDSLFIQLQQKGYSTAYKILKNHALELEHRDFDSISESLEMPLEDILKEFSHIQECTPFPCSSYDTETYTDLALPEFSIVVEDNNINIIPKEIGTLSLHIEDVPITKELKKYLNEAKFYIDSLNKRNKTMLLLSNILVTHQKNYFLFQDDLEVCTLKDIANESGYSISTVSRTLSDKYYEFNNQIFPIKDLFVSQTRRGTSKDYIQKTIKLLIESEEKENPLLDEQIVEELNEMGLYVSRRTISKYRNELHIPNSKQRKKKYFK